MMSGGNLSSSYGETGILHIATKINIQNNLHHLIRWDREMIVWCDGFVRLLLDHYMTVGGAF